MMTVKLVEPSGHEEIHEVTDVWRRPDGGVYAIKAKGEELCFGAYGTVYVMNEAGKTVAVYGLEKLLAQPTPTPSQPAWRD